MKDPLRLLPIAAACLLPTAAKAYGPVPVIDAAHMAANQVSNTIDYIQQILHEANQQTQIGNQLEQIAELYTQIEQLYEQIDQMDDYLDRFGDPETILNLAGVGQLTGSLRTATGGLDLEALLPEITGEGFYNYTGEGIFEAIEETFTVADVEFERKPERYKSNDAVRATVEQYREKKADVIARRDTLRKEVASTTDQLKGADTDAEVQKLTGVLIGLQTELHATDRELDIARGDAEARALENANQEAAQAKADGEVQAERIATANHLDVETYKLDQSAYGW